MNENEHLENRKYCEKNGYKKNRYGKQEKILRILISMENWELGRLRNAGGKWKFLKLFNSFQN